MGPHSVWVITDEAGTILDLPFAPPFDFEGAGAGVCLIWHLRYIDGLAGANIGENAANLQGCYDLSNPITVTRETGTDCSSNTVTPEEEEVTPGFVSDFKVMPNPATDMLVLETDVMPMEGTTVFIYDRMGQMIDKVLVKDEKVEIRLDNYTEGFYYVKMLSGTNEMSKSFIKLQP